MLELYTEDAEGSIVTSQILHLGDKIRLDYDPAAWEFIVMSLQVFPNMLNKRCEPFNLLQLNVLFSVRYIMELGRVQPEDPLEECNQVGFKSKPVIVDVKTYAPSHWVSTDGTYKDCDMDTYGVVTDAPKDSLSDIVTEHFENNHEMNQLEMDLATNKIPWKSRDFMQLLEDDVVMEETDSGGSRASMRAAGVSPAKVGESFKEKANRGRIKLFVDQRDGMAANFLAEFESMKCELVDSNGYYSKPENESTMHWTTETKNKLAAVEKANRSLKLENKMLLDRIEDQLYCVTAQEHQDQADSFMAAKSELDHKIHILGLHKVSQEGVLHALKEKWEARGKCIAESGVRLNAQHHAYQELRVKYTRLEAELDTTREFIGRTGNKRPRETPMSAALVRTPPNQMPLLPDPDTTQEFESVESM